MNKKNPLTGPSFEPNKSPKKCVILLHGYGDNGENFISLAQEFYDLKLNANFFAPNAPSNVPQYPIGRQWFDLYPNGINFNQAGVKEKEILKEDCTSSLILLKEYIDVLCSKYFIKYEDFFILGFSQGAMMAFELGKYINQVFAGCILLSGRILPSGSHNKKPFIKTPMMIVHGGQDTVLEPKYFDEACSILQQEGFLFEQHFIRREGHTISPEILNLVQNFIKKNMV